MKRAFFGCLALGLVVAGCKTDPTADLGKSATRVKAQYTAVTLVAGDSIIVTASVKDGQDVSLPELVTPSSANAAVATVSDGYLPPLPISRFYIKGVAAGTTVVNVSSASGGASTSIDVIVN
ncbi:MAG: hypothetical protein OEY20_14430 [Gemmatimonadota bacterium]|nr:hypothetical protein [Gemmatimonadota bacterium]MDH5198435.1 hypothetical protein [Gemmatimonadota bacterium]